MEAQRLRELMRQEKAKRNRPPPKFAQWREAGQLQCTICKGLVNSEKLWDTHLRSIPHLKVLETLRRQLEDKKRSEAEAAAKEKLANAFGAASDSEEEEENGKKDDPVTSSGPVETSISKEKPASSSSIPEKPHPSSSSSAPAPPTIETMKKIPSTNDNQISKEPEVTKSPRRREEEDESEAKKPRLIGPLPPEAFTVDQITLAEVEDLLEQQNQDEENPDEANAIPDGFFDDEDDQARAFGVKKPSQKKEERMESELRKFEAIMEKEDQRMHAVRQDMDQLAFNLQSREERALQRELRKNNKTLRKKIEKQRALKKEKEESSSSGSDIDDANLLDFDWRAKSF